jgi:hypothetical protein
MANQTNCPSCNALLRSASPLPPGASIKCPKCGTTFRVGDPPAGKSSARAPAGGAPAFTGDDDAGGIVAKPKKKGSKTWLWLLLLLGGGLVVCLGCCGGGGAIMWFTVIKPMLSDETLVGKWEIDAAETKKINPAFDSTKPYIYEFDGKEKTATFNEAGKTRKGSWVAVREKGSDELALVFQADTGQDKINFTIIDNDHLQVKNATFTPANVRWKRVSGGAGSSK